MIPCCDLVSCPSTSGGQAGNIKSRFEKMANEEAEVRFTKRTRWKEGSPSHRDSTGSINSRLLIREIVFGCRHNINILRCFVLKVPLCRQKSNSE